MTPPVTGQACLPGQGVTVVVDFTPADSSTGADGPIEIGCAVGAQKTVSAATANAGFTPDPAKGFVCSIDAVLAEPKGCGTWPGAFWSMFISTADGNPGGPASTEWAFANVGLDGGPVPVGTALLYQIQPYTEDSSSRKPLIALADLPGYQPSDAPVPPSAGRPASDPDVLASAGWLGRQLAAAGDVLTTSGKPDWGLTADAVFALAAAGVGRDQIDAAAAKIENSGRAYVGAPGDPTKWSAVAKAALVLQVAGLDPTAFPDGATSRNLLTELRGAMNADGSFGTSDAPFLHSLAVLALARTEGGVPAAAVSWLEDQQCATAGAGKGSYGWSACAGDIDTTAFTVQALQAAGVSTSAAPIAGATTWIVGQQGSDGGLPSFGDFNANSTGLGAQALLGVGQSAPAAKAAGFIGSLSVSCAALTATSPGFTQADLGAIAYDGAGWDGAASAGVADDLDSWIRATTQGILALGLPTFGAITAAGASAALPAAPDCAPATTTTTTTTTSGITPAATLTLGTTSVTAGHTITVSVTGAGAHQTLTVSLHSDPIVLGTLVTDADGSGHAEFTIPADTPAGVHRIVVTGPGITLEATITVRAAGPILAETGAPAATVPMAVGGVGLLLVGAALLTIGRRTRRAAVARHRH